MNEKARLIGLFFAAAGVVGISSYLVLQASVGVYGGWVLLALAWLVMIFSMRAYLSKTQAVLATLAASIWLSAGSFIASAFHDTPAAWFFLIAAVVSLLMIPLVVKYLSSNQAGESPEVSEPCEGSARWLLVGVQWLFVGVAAILLVYAGYLGWRVWARLSENVLILATVALILLIVFSMSISGVKKNPQHWLSREGLFTLSRFLNNLLVPATLILLLLNFMTK